jgi:hypothetical protein
MACRAFGAGQVDLSATDAYPRDDVVGLVGAQVIAADLAEAEEETIHPVVHLL